MSQSLGPDGLPAQQFVGSDACASPASRSSAAGTRALRVLVLEDDPDTREMLELLLVDEEGFEVESCASAEACVERLRDGPYGGQGYDVLLLDLLLPDGHSGVEVIEAAHASPDLHLPPVVVCTALSDSLLARYRPALDACGASIVEKPFDADVLTAEVRRAAKRGTAQ